MKDRKLLFKGIYTVIMLLIIITSAWLVLKPEVWSEDAKITLAVGWFILFAIYYVFKGMKKI